MSRSRMKPRRTSGSSRYSSTMYTIIINTVSVGVNFSCIVRKLRPTFEVPNQRAVSVVLVIVPRVVKLPALPLIRYATVIDPLGSAAALTRTLRPSLLEEMLAPPKYGNVIDCVLAALDILLYNGGSLSWVRLVPTRACAVSLRAVPAHKKCPMVSWFKMVKTWLPAPE